MLSNISDLFTMASLVICMLLSGIIFYYLRTRINMLEQSVMDQAHLLQQVVTSIKSSQFRQMTANATVSQQNSQNDQCPVENSNSRLNLIQVSDDDDGSSNDSSGDDDDDDESTSCESNDYDDDDDNNNINGSSKIIDLSAITSSSLPISLSSYSSKHDDIKIIELKSSIKLNDKDESDDDDDDDEDDDDDDDDDDDEDDDEEDDDTDADANDADANDADANDADVNDADADTKNKLNNTSINNNHKKFKSIVIEDITNSTASNSNSSSISLDEMKNMPVNTLRTLAKTKLNNVDPPIINKMSKKEILKALNE